MLLSAASRALCDGCRLLLWLPCFLPAHLFETYLQGTTDCTWWPTGCEIWGVQKEKKINFNAYKFKYLKDSNVEINTGVNFEDLFSPVTYLTFQRLLFPKQLKLYIFTVRYMVSLCPSLDLWMYHVARSCSTISPAVGAGCPCPLPLFPPRSELSDPVTTACPVYLVRNGQVSSSSSLSSSGSRLLFYLL